MLKALVAAEVPKKLRAREKNSAQVCPPAYLSVCLSVCACLSVPVCMADALGFFPFPSFALFAARPDRPAQCLLERARSVQ